MPSAIAEMRVLVTRPEPDASATVAILLSLGLEPVLAPMLALVDNADAAIDPEGVQAVVATSRAAVRALAARTDAAALKALPLLTVGAATATAARKSGFTAVSAAGGTSDDLIARVGATLDPAAGALVYAAGRDRSGDVDGALAARGFSVRLVELYRAEPLPLAGAVADMIRAGQLDAILVFSRRTAEMLVSRMTDNNCLAEGRSIPVHVISEAAAEPLRAAGFRRLIVALKPTAESLVVSLGVDFRARS